MTVQNRTATAFPSPRSAERPLVAPSARERHRERLTLLLAVALVDIGIIVGASAAAWSLRGAVRAMFTGEVATPGTPFAAPALIVTGVWIAVLHQRQVWRPRHLAADLDEFRAITTASGVALGIVVLADFVLNLQLARAYVLLTFAIGIPALMLSHLALRKLVHGLRRRGSLRHRVVVVGTPRTVSEVRSLMGPRPELGYDLVGACVPAGVTRTRDLDLPYLGAAEDIRSICDSVDADTVLVMGGGFDSTRDLTQIGWALQGSAIQLIVAPSLVDVAGPRVQMRVVAGLPLVHVEEPQVGQAGGIGKRAFDLVGGLLALILAAPVLLAAAVLIKLEDGGPVFYRQRRVGRDGGTFGCWKLRTMKVGADLEEANLRAAAAHDGALFKLTDDPRVTRIGKHLRRFSVDELPQLFNVVVGQMSLVGPRPQQEWEAETYDDATRRRLLVRPGMTGLWQVSGRSHLPWEEAIRLDLYYVDNWSMAGDLMIVIKTVRAVLARDGAY